MKYLLFHCLLSFQWALRKALPVFIPPYQVFMHIDQVPPGLSLWPGPLSASSPVHPLHEPIPAHPGQVCTGSPSAPGVASAELSKGQRKAQLPWAAPPEPAQHPVGILGKNRAREGVSSPGFCVTSLKLGAATCLHQRESKNSYQCFNYLLKMRQLPLK